MQNLSAMQDFVMWFINNLSAFLLSEPIIYFVGIFFGGCIVKLLRDLIHISN